MKSIKELEAEDFLYREEDGYLQALKDIIKLIDERLFLINKQIDIYLEAKYKGMHLMVLQGQKSVFEELKERISGT